MAGRGRKLSTCTKFQRPAQFQNSFRGDILLNQQTDATGEVADALLVCNGGNIRAHAFLLQAASPLFQAVFASQGENYPFVREIIIPDFSVKLMEQVVGLIYKGVVDMRGDDEVTRFKEAVEFFQITSVDQSQDKSQPIKGALKIEETNRIPQEIFKVEDVKLNDDEASPRVVVVTEGRPKRTRRAARSKDTTDSDCEYIPNGDSPSPKKRGRPVTCGLSVRVNRLPEAESSKKTQDKVKDATSPTRSAPVVAAKPKKVYPADDGSEKSDSGTDTEDEGWEAPDYKSVDWFNNVSRTCQKCKKVHERPQDASLCITSHRRLRCYFCFNIYSTTDVLFKHFKRRHKSAGRDSTLICPYCDQPVPYKSVSCHVISTHLGKMRAENGSPNGGSASGSGSSPDKPVHVMRTGPGRPPTAASSAPTSRASSVATEIMASQVSEKNGEKAKQGPKLKLPKPKKRAPPTDENKVLRVPDLNMTIKKTTAFGKTLTFKITKKRLCTQVP